MRKAGVIPDPALGQRFGDYLLAHGIDNRVDQTDQGAVVWVVEEDQVPQAGRELAAFLSEPDHPKYSRRLEAHSIRAHQAREDQLAKKRFIDVRVAWTAGQRAGGPITLGLIAVCVGLYLVLNLGLLGPVSPEFQQSLWFASAPGRWLEDLAAGEWWRLVSPVLLHGGLLHLGFNMLWLYHLGRQIELRRGRLVYVGLLMGIAVISNLTQYLWAGPYFMGMSGVVYGLFGYVWMQGRYLERPDVGIDRNNSIFIMAWFVLCLTGLLGAVANGAHAGGLLAGAIAGSGPFLRRQLGRS